MSQQTIRIILWILGLCAIIAAATADASYKPTVCINGWVSKNQAAYIERAAWELGFATYHETPRIPFDGTCAVYFIRGDGDTWLRNGRTYVFRGMSYSKARRVLAEWMGCTR